MPQNFLLLLFYHTHHTLPLRERERYSNQSSTLARDAGKCKWGVSSSRCISSDCPRHHDYYTTVVGARESRSLVCKSARWEGMGGGGDRVRRTADSRAPRVNEYFFHSTAPWPTFQMEAGVSSPLSDTQWFVKKKKERKKPGSSGWVCVCIYIYVHMYVYRVSF